MSVGFAGTATAQEWAQRLSAVAIDQPGKRASGAALSADGVYRYQLWRHWGDGSAGTAVFLMLNPSTASALIDDATIRKCIGFAKRWGLHGIRVVNLFAFRSTKPEGLVLTTCPVGLHNDDVLRAVLGHRGAEHEPAPRVVAAWGSCSKSKVRYLTEVRAANVVGNIVADVPLLCLGTAKDGSPRHPLMLAYDTQFEPWRLP